jgi:predicted ribosomally synthesized peptide with nif11-like leader
MPWRKQQAWDWRREMSEEAAKAFVERAKSDAEFRDRVMGVEGREERLALIREEGFDCTAEEISAQGHPLADEELVGESGGFCAPAAPQVCGSAAPQVCGPAAPHVCGSAASLM